MPRNSPLTCAHHRDRTAVLIAVIAEIVLVFTLCPCLYCIAQGTGVSVYFILLVAEALGTSGFLFYCIGLDLQRSTCEEVRGSASQVSCHKALEKVIALGVVRVLVVVPSCVAVTVFFRDRDVRRRRRRDREIDRSPGPGRQPGEDDEVGTGTAL